MKKQTMRLLTALTAFVLIASYVLPAIASAEENIYETDAVILEDKIIADNVAAPENVAEDVAADTAVEEVMDNAGEYCDTEPDEPADTVEDPAAVLVIPADEMTADPEEEASEHDAAVISDENGEAAGNGSDESSDEDDDSSESGTGGRTENKTEEENVPENSDADNTKTTDNTGDDDNAGDTGNPENIGETAEETENPEGSEESDNIQEAEENDKDITLLENDGQDDEDELIDDEDGSVIISENETIGTPLITGIDISKNGVVISWGAVEGAEGYAVYRRPAAGTDWTRLKKTAETSYTDGTAEAGNSYYYTVRAYNTKDGSINPSGYYYPGTYYVYLTNPKITGAVNIAGGIKLTWDKVNGADNYHIYRKAGKNGSYSKIAETAETLFEDKTAVSGTTYYYVVRASASNSGRICMSYYNSATAVECIGVPILQKITDISGGYILTWGKVDGADLYYVYRKPAGGKWKRIARTTEESYTDEILDSGTKYYYTVIAAKKSSSGVIYSGYQDPGIGYIHLDTPMISNVANSATGIKVTWDKVNGAGLYRVYRKTGRNGKYTYLGNVSNNQFIDKTADSGNLYFYSVRAYSADEEGTYRSHYEKSSKYTYYIAAPELTSLTAAEKGYTLEWKAVNGAASYTVYRKAAGGKWTGIGTVKTTSFTDTQGKAGTKYYYTVRASRKAGSVTFNGSYNTAGLCCKYLETPKMNNTSMTASGLKVTWEASEGADKYRVYRRTGTSGKYVLIGAVTGTAYIDKTVESGKEYFYTVRAYAEDEDSRTLSYYERPGAGGMWIGTPVLTSAKEIQLTGTTITWKKVAGADQYMIYRKTKDGKWGLLGYSTTTSYTDYSGVTGTNYYYTVRAVMNSGENSYAGSYDKEGIACVFLKSLYTMLKSEGTLSEEQKNIINVTYSTPATAAGLCAAWVLNILSQLGITYDYLTSLRPSIYSYAYTSGLTNAEYAYDMGFNANDFWAYVCTSDDLKDLKPGMIVATRSSYTDLGSQFGHIGMYVGDNTVISSIGYLETTTVAEFYQKYNNTSYGSTMRWGFMY